VKPDKFVHDKIPAVTYGLLTNAVKDGPLR